MINALAPLGASCHGAGKLGFSLLKIEKKNKDNAEDKVAQKEKNLDAAKDNLGKAKDAADKAQDAADKAGKSSLLQVTDDEPSDAVAPTLPETNTTAATAALPKLQEITAIADQTAKANPIVVTKVEQQPVQLTSNLVTASLAEVAEQSRVSDGQGSCVI